MTVPSQTFVTGSAVGNQEDVSDVIYRIDPTDTPFITMCERETATNINHEWQTQALTAASGTNYQTEGDDVALDAVTATVRLGNYAQISRKARGVSGTQRAVAHYGREDELDYQMNLAGLELKRDMETTLCGTNQAKASTDPRKSASVISWIKTNTVKGTGGTDPSAADGTGTRGDASAGNQTAFSEGSLRTVLMSIWTNGGKPDIVMTGGFNKQQFSTFQGRAQATEDTRPKKITAVVNFYDSDFGLLEVVPNRFMRARDVLVLQEDMWAVAYISGRRFVSEDLAKTGDSDRKFILSEYTLMARNEKSSGGVFDNTTA